MSEKADREDRFMKLLKPIQSAAERYAVSICSDRDSARDILQDAIIIAWRNLDEIRDHSAFKSYLFTIITNLSRKQFHKQRFFDRMTDGVEENLISSQPQPDRLTDATLVKEALNKLPNKSREALVLFEINDLSVEEISRIQNSSISAVKVRLMRARRSLALLLGIKEMRGHHVSA